MRRMTRPCKNRWKGWLCFTRLYFLKLNLLLIFFQLFFWCFGAFSLTQSRIKEGLRWIQSWRLSPRVEVLHEAVASGKRLGAIFKDIWMTDEARAWENVRQWTGRDLRQEPTITPTTEQVCISKHDVLSPSMSLSFQLDQNSLNPLISRLKALLLGLHWLSVACERYVSGMWAAGEGVWPQEAFWLSQWRHEKETQRETQMRSDWIWRKKYPTAKGPYL